MRTSSYRDLKVWRKAIDLALETYRLADQLPKHETYGLAGQLRRSAVSVPANIAEGNSRYHRGEYCQHISIARGSLAELETLLELARRSLLLSTNDVATADDLAGQVGKMLTRLAAALRK